MDSRDLKDLVADSLERLETAIRDAAQLNAAALIMTTGDRSPAVAAAAALELFDALGAEREKVCRARIAAANEAGRAAREARAKKAARLVEIRAQLAAGGERLTAVPPDCPEGPSLGTLLEEEQAELEQELYG